MSATEISTTPAEESEAPVPVFTPEAYEVAETPEGLTKQARSLTRSFAQGVIKAETLVYHLAQVMLAFAATCVAPEYSVNVKDPSKQRGYRKPGSPEVPDYGMQSAEYKQWRAKNIDAVAAEVITDPTLYQSVVQNRLRYRVQTLRVKTVEDSILKALNLSTETQAQRQAATANAERSRNDSAAIGADLFNESEALRTETVGENPPVPVHEIASAVGIGIEALNKRLTPETVEAMGKKERTALASLIEQYEATLDSMRQVLSGVAEQVAA